MGNQRPKFSAHVDGWCRTNIARAIVRIAKPHMELLEELNSFGRAGRLANKRRFGGSFFPPANEACRVAEHVTSSGPLTVGQHSQIGLHDVSAKPMRITEGLS